MIKQSDSSQIDVFSKKEIFECLLDNFNYDYYQSNCLVLDTLYYLLKISRQKGSDHLNSTLRILELCNFPNILEELQKHPEQTVYDISTKIIVDFYDYDSL